MKQIKFIFAGFGLFLLMTASALAQTTTLVSVNRSGTSSSNTQSFLPQVNANGRFVVFESDARELVEYNTAYRVTNIYVRDLREGTTHLVSVKSEGHGSGNAVSASPAMSANGRFIVFMSYASNLVTNDTNGNTLDIFVRDMVAGTTKLVSINNSGTGSANGESRWATISADGRFVAFQSAASDLVAGASAGGVYVRDLKLGVTTLVSVNQTGNGNGNGLSSRAKISANGHYVTFSSRASDLVPNDTNGVVEDVFFRDLTAGTTKLVSVNWTGTGSGDKPSITNIYSTTVSANGRFVPFFSFADDLVKNDHNGKTDVFVRDMVAGTTELMSVNVTGTNGGNDHTSSDYAISPNGRFVLMTTRASDLVANDFNSEYDVFVRDRVAGRTLPMSVNRAGTGTSNNRSIDAKMSGKGRFVVFWSYATDLTDNDVTQPSDIFVRDLLAGTTTLVSVDSAGTGGSHKNSYMPAISSDGQTVAFQSFAKNLAPNDPVSNLDVFATSLAGGSLQFSATNYRVDEGGGVITVKVKRTGKTSEQVTVDFVTSNGTAIAGEDYASTSGTLTFAIGEMVKTITVPVNDDASDETAETINLSLSNPTGKALLAARSRVALIIDDND